jgi:GAF domain-containing protein
MCGGSAMSGIEDRYDRAKAFIAGQPDPATGGGTAGVLRRVCGAAVQTMAASGAGVTLMTGDGVRGVGAASDPGSARLEELQFTFGEGPCIDAYVSRRPVLVPELADGAMSRWPVYAPAVHAQGVRAVFAFPLQIGAARLGVLDVFRDRAGALTSDELQQGVLLADVTVAALLDQHEQYGADAGADCLDEAVEGRAELFQAQGMVMVQLGGSIGEAMARMRAYAYAQDRRLGEVARDIVARRLHFDPDR